MSEKAPASDLYEVIGDEVTYRIAHRRAKYHVLKIRRPVIKLKSSAKILCLAAPALLQRISEHHASP